MDTENSAADLNAQPAEQSGAEKAAEPETPAGAARISAIRIR